MPFFDRAHELVPFDRAYAAARRRGQLFLLSGRLGAGKTTLVQQWLASRRKRALVWTPQEDADEIQQALSFAQAMGRFLKRQPVPHASFASEVWRDAFLQFSEAAGSRRHIVVIDQATDVMPMYSALVNGLKQAWDHELQYRAVFVILIGDHAARIHEHLRSYSRAPLYGRFTAIWPMDPIAWQDFSAVLMRWPVRERLLAYAITGGWPIFAKDLAPQQRPGMAMARLMRSRDYWQSARSVVETVGPTRTTIVRAVLRALAMGPAHQALLARRAGLSRRKVNAALVDLETAGLVTTRDTPSEAPLPWAERLVFRLVDQQVRFAFLAWPKGTVTVGRSVRANPLRPVAQTDSLLSDLVSVELLAPWLFRAGSRGRLPEAVDDLGPVTAELPCDAALAALDRRHRRVLVCGIFGQARPLGEDRVRAFIGAATRVLSTSWSGWSGRVLVVSLAGFTSRARRLQSSDGVALVAAESLNRDLAEWSRRT